jgi:membrane protease YdiL (CAAX protease family)
MEPTLTPLPPSRSTAEPSAPELPPLISPGLRVGYWGEVWLVIAVWVIPAFVLGITYQVWPIEDHPNAGSWYTIGLAVGAVTLAVFLMKRSGDSWAEFGLTQFGLADVLKGVLIASALFLVQWALLELRSEKHAFGKDDLGKWVFFRPVEANAGRMLIFVAFLASALSDELLLRAVLITRLRALLGSPTMAVIATAFLYAACNSQYGWSGATVVFAWGLVLGIAFCWWRSVWPVAIAHFLLGVVPVALGDAFPNMVVR